MSKLINVVKNDIVKKTVYNKLVAKVDNIDTSDFVLKTNYNTKITELENKIPSVSNLVKKKQTITLKLQKSKINLITIIMINILILQSSTL